MPVVSRADTFIYAQDLNEVARFVGLDEHIEPVLDPDELIARMKLVLDIAVGSLQQIPPEALHDKLPGRDRSYLDLGNHIVAIYSGCLAVTKGQAFTGAIAKASPKVNLSPNELATLATDVTNQLEEWWSQRKDPHCSRTVSTFYGEQSLHAVIERCTWHVTQHVRQLMMVLQILGVTPQRPLTAAHLADLPLPQEVWDG
ncbi:MAG: DinB family protein [Proteobacteria bacterium]|nr:DinB family protein [Pseudomonadota bacterium]